MELFKAWIQHSMSIKFSAKKKRYEYQIIIIECAPIEIFLVRFLIFVFFDLLIFYRQDSHGHLFFIVKCNNVVITNVVANLTINLTYPREIIHYNNFLIQKII